MPQPSLGVVTDPVVIKEIERQGLNVNDVDFVQDYGPRKKGVSSPYMKRYQHKTGRQFAVISGLPMVNHAGKRVSPKWRNTGPESYESEENQFIAKVTGNRIYIEAINDQPSGTKKGDIAKWQPQLFLNGIEQISTRATLLNVDPTNENYIHNTIEWDYGICKHRVRLIEGKLKDRWYFENDPQGEIRIQHNLSGSIPLKFGFSRDADGEPLEVLVIDDTEIVQATTFTKTPYPVIIGASPETFYPDVPDETNSVDGFVYETTVASWATIRTAAGDGANDADDNMLVGLSTAVSSPDYDRIYRIIALFYTESLPNDCTVTDAALSIYGHTKDNDLDDIDINVYKSTPFSNTALQADDYVDIGSTALSSTIAYGAYNVSGYNAFTLLDVDTDDFGYISKTAVTKLGAREVTHDVDGGDPTWAQNAYSRLYSYQSDKGAGFKPKLVVTYTIPSGGNPWWYYQLIRRQ